MIGPPRLIVTQTKNLAPSGGMVTVHGTGFEPNQGVYVAFCLKPASGQAPSPCGGGADTDGDSGASRWISSNPPPYGRGLAIPYGSNGSFVTTIRVTGSIGTIDCLIQTCGVATRADHTRSSDRSQDVFVPISFRSGS